jgi:glycosyl-4,4'-diaponeurosporenoate acyltransferase
LSFTLWMIIVNTSFWLVCHFGIAWGVRLFSRSLYERNKWFFKEYPFEKRLYKKIHLVKWKDKLPELGRMMNFEKKHLKKQVSLKYIDKFILETYYAEFGHLAIAILGFLCILVNPSEYIRMALICSVINFIIQIPFCLIQRYNRPRLVRLKSRLNKGN